MADEPPYLTVGTEVSAKYRGAFCEAKVKKVNKQVKIKVNLKETSQPMTVTEADVLTEKPSLKVGSCIEVRHLNTGQTVEAIVNKVNDQSTYTVEFNDGDVSTLRRSQINLKGDKHYVRTETLDDLPLTNPEHFSSPVGRRYQRRRGNFSSDSESSDDEEMEERNTYPDHTRSMLGKVSLMRMEDRKKSMLVPVLVVLPSADATPLPTADHVLVKSFKDSKFYTARRQELREFNRDTVLKNEDRALKVFFEKALLYFDGGELPKDWNSKELLGEAEEDGESSEEETNEEKDRFVAQLYKFMDDRGTPFNKAPTIGSRDLDLYKLYRLVQRLGGYNRVNNQMKWRLVASKMGLTATTNSQTQAKNAYKKFLYPYDEFYRKLGSTMGTAAPRSGLSRSVPRRSMMRQEVSPKAHGSKIELPKSEMLTPKSQSSKSELKDEGRSPSKSQQGSPIANLSPRVVITTSLNSPVAKETKPANESSAGKSDMKEVSIKETPSKKAAEESSDGEGRRRTRQEKGRSLKDDTPTGKIVKDDTPSEESDDSRQKRVCRKKPVPSKSWTSDTEETKSSREPEDEDTVSVAESNKTDDGEHGGVTRDYSDFEFPPGSRLRIRYGKGKNIKAYEAKVLEAEEDETGVQHYYVHYNGWNLRYDEWITKERVQDVVQRMDPKKVTKMLAGTKIPSLKRKNVKAHPSHSWTGETTIMKDEKLADKNFQSSKPGRPPLPPRPTRSTSVEAISKKRHVMSSENTSADEAERPAEESGNTTPSHEAAYPLHINTEAFKGSQETGIPELSPIKEIVPQQRNFSVSSDMMEPPEITGNEEEGGKKDGKKKSPQVKTRAGRLKEQDKTGKSGSAVPEVKAEPQVKTEPEEVSPAPRRITRTKAELKAGISPANRPVEIAETAESRETRGKRGGKRKAADAEEELSGTPAEDSKDAKKAKRRKGGVKMEEESSSQEEVGGAKADMEEEPSAEETKVVMEEPMEQEPVEGWSSVRSVEDEPVAPNESPNSPEQSPDSDNGNYECSQSEVEANLEVETFFLASQAAGNRSPGEQSTASDESTNKDSLDSDATSSQHAPKHKPEEETTFQVQGTKKTKLSKKGSFKKKDGAGKRAAESEDDEEKSESQAGSKINILTYNLLDRMKEGDELEGDDLINFLLEKVKECRTVYADLKAEMASLERRRKRYRKKQRLAVQALMGLETAQ